MRCNSCCIDREPRNYFNSPVWLGPSPLTSILANHQGVGQRVQGRRELPYTTYDINSRRYGLLMANMTQVPNCGGGFPHSFIPTPIKCTQCILTLHCIHTCTYGSTNLKQKRRKNSSAATSSSSALLHGTPRLCACPIGANDLRLFYDSCMVCICLITGRARLLCLSKKVKILTAVTAAVPFC